MWNREVCKSPKWDVIELGNGVKEPWGIACSVECSAASRIDGINCPLSQKSLCELGLHVASHDFDHDPRMDINSSAGFSWKPQRSRVAVSLSAFTRCCCHVW